MKKLNSIIISLILGLTMANGADCIIAEELNVKFINDSTQYVNDQIEIDKITKFKDFIEATNLYVLIEGHTNNLSAAVHNLALSTKRANKVRSALIEQGLKASHVRSMGFGESTPIYTNDTADGKAKNRRVIGEVFNTAADLDAYIKKQKSRIKPILNKEQ
jgi:OOP family OmpA-OmpF porin